MGKISVNLHKLTIAQPKNIDLFTSLRHPFFFVSSRVTCYTRSFLDENSFATSFCVQPKREGSRYLGEKDTPN